MKTKTTEAEIIFSERDRKKNSVIAAVGYLNILFLLPLLLKKDSPFAQFHAKQGMFLFVVFFVGQLFFWIPLIGWAAFLYYLAVNAYAFFQALMGKVWKVPGAAWMIQKFNI